MRRSAVLLALAVLASGLPGAHATTIIGDLNNFDTLNDTGQVCYGFEIGIDDVHSTDITYTYDWNHYGAPKIRQDNTDPLHPKVFVRYESTKDALGNWGANNSYTNTAIPTISPPAGHTCTDPSVNQGCEHFGVGYYGTPTAIRYNWLIDGGAAGLVPFGSPVPVAAPKFAYTPPPAPGQPGAQVVAAIPAPVVPIPPGRQFGEASWVKVIKTTTHSVNPVALGDLISDDADNDGRADWQNKEPDQVEMEWYLLQTNSGANPAKAELKGAADDMGDGSETVTRRYEFYRYGANLDTLDGENGEAMCSAVNPTTNPADPNYLHGVGDHVAVTDANGDTYYVNCAAQVVVGNYIGAQMAGFAAAAPLGLIDHLQDGGRGAAYMPRTVIVGGNTPFVITIANGSLPAGMSIGPLDGVLAGTPLAGGDFPFTLQVTDADNVSVNQVYTLRIAGLIAAPNLTGVVSRKLHAAAGPLDLALAATPANPTIEPRTAGAGGTHVVVFAFDKLVTGGAAAVTGGTGAAGVPTFNGNEMSVPLSGVANAQYVTVTVTSVASADGGTGGSGSIRLGLLRGDVDGSGAVTLSDMLLVNAVLAQPLTNANFRRDVDVSGSLTLSDKLVVNANLTQFLPAP